MKKSSNLMCLKIDLLTQLCISNSLHISLKKLNIINLYNSYYEQCIVKIIILKYIYIYKFHIGLLNFLIFFREVSNCQDNTLIIHN